MLATYKKSRYGGPFGYRVNHTVGLSAEDSTMDHPHFASTFLVFYFMHGSGTIKIEGKTYKIGKGDIILLNPAEMFHCSVDNNIYHERMVLHLDRSLLGTLPGDTSVLWAPFLNREKGIGNRIPAETVRSCGWDVTLETILQLEQKGDPVSRIMAYGKVIELLAELAQSTAGSDTQPRESTLIDEVLVYLNDNFTEDITVTDVATLFFVNPSYLAHLFKEYTGMPLWTYVILRRLHYFNELVRQGVGVEEASRRVGFRNYSNFFRLYKKYRGMTPTDYRKQWKEGKGE